MLQSMRAAAKYIWIIIVITFVGGFLLVETSGLLGRAPVTASTPVVTVNGEEVPYQAWINLSQELAQQREQQLGRGLTLDERRRIDDEAFDQLVSNVLLQQEYAKRHIAVSDDEIVEAARYSPPPQLMQNPELQTDGRFDMAKYQRFLASPAARSQGLLAQLEAYYRNELPRLKLLQQIAADAYVTDDQLWRAWRDAHDSAQVSFVAFDAASVPDSAVTVTDGEARAYYDAHKKEFDRPGRAVVTVTGVPRAVTAADTAAARNHALAVRDEIVKGAKFEDVARRESIDTISGARGGDLGRTPKGRFVKQFEDAAFALKPRELSQPVLSPFGFHIIRVDSIKGDTLAAHHILIKLGQSDSSATRSDRLADRLSAMAASSDDPRKFDAAVRSLGLQANRATVVEGEPLTINGRYVPSVSAWAFGGAKPGETSELFDADDAYYLARLDSLTEGGQQPFEAARDEVRAIVARRKKVQALLPEAQRFARAAAASSLEQAAQASKVAVQKPPAFTRGASVSGLGQGNEAIGAAFALPVGRIGAPIATDHAAIVMRVDRRVEADRTAWEAQKAVQRQEMVQALRQQRVRAFLEGMREQAKIEDNRKKINAAARKTAT